MTPTNSWTKENIIHACNFCIYEYILCLYEYVWGCWPVGGCLQIHIYVFKFRPTRWGSAIPYIRCRYQRVVPYKYRSRDISVHCWQVTLWLLTCCTFRVTAKHNFVDRRLPAIDNDMHALNSPKLRGARPSSSEMSFCKLWKAGLSCHSPFISSLSESWLFALKLFPLGERGHRMVAHVFEVSLGVAGDLCSLAARALTKRRTCSYSWRCAISLAIHSLKSHSLSWLHYLFLGFNLKDMYLFQPSFVIFLWHSSSLLPHLFLSRVCVCVRARSRSSYTKV